VTAWDPLARGGRTRLVSPVGVRPEGVVEGHTGVDVQRVGEREHREQHAADLVVSDLDGRRVRGVATRLCGVLGYLAELRDGVE
jgi:hypothetical protein